MTLVTVANVAKFLSESIFLLHYEAWKAWMRWKAKRKGNTEEANEPIFQDDEDEQVSLPSLWRAL